MLTFVRNLPAAMFAQLCLQEQESLCHLLWIYTLLCVHLLAVFICCTSILGFHPIPFINIISWLSFPLHILFFFNLFLFITCFHTSPFSSLLSPAVFTSLHRSCFLHDVPQQGHCTSVTMFHKTLQSSFFLSSSTDLG